MTGPDEPALLTAQLEAALSGADADPHVAIEAAALAGQRARTGVDDALQAAARRLQPEGVALAEAAEDAADAIAELEPEDGEDVAWDRLCHLDEVCAAAWWFDRVELVAPSVSLAVSVVHAFPETWAPLAPAASRLLVHAPPAPGDPALALWRAVEVAAPPAPVEVEAPSEILLDDLFHALGLRGGLRASLADVAPVFLLADGGAPPRPPWEVLASGDGWELVLTWGDRREPVILLATDCDQRPEVTHDGDAVHAAACPDGWTWPAREGTWTVRWDDQHASFEIDP